jgi:hypothetical protein
VRQLDAGDGRDPAVMAQALRVLPAQDRPSDAFLPGLLDGLDRIEAMTLPWLEVARRRARAACVGVAAE